ncbi:MAG: DUF1622 domain-containing protein [Candidatus Gracilibacteria bacterium]
MTNEILIAELLKTCGLMVGSLGVLIILVGVLKSLKIYLSLEFFKNTHHLDIDTVRYKLGTYLLLGLEFLVAADILETVFTPTLERIAILGGIVIIRTVLNFFLNKELERIGKKEVL